MSAPQACRFGSPDMGIGESICCVGVSTGDATGEGRSMAGVAVVATPGAVAGAAAVLAVPAIGTSWRTASAAT